jgi:hypothetical protein
MCFFYLIGQTHVINYVYLFIYKTYYLYNKCENACHQWKEKIIWSLKNYSHILEVYEMICLKSEM